MNELHASVLASNAADERLEAIHETLIGLASDLAEQRGIPETDNDDEILDEIALALVDRLRKRVVNGEFPA